MEQKKTNVCGIISLTLGIIGLMATCLNIGWLPAIPGAILGLIGMCLPGYKKGIAIAGFIVNIAAFVLGICVIYFLTILTDALEQM